MRSDVGERSCWLRMFVKSRGVLIERGTFQKRALRGLTLRFGVGRRCVLASLNAALLLLLIECEQLFVVVRGGGLEGVIIELLDHIKPKDIHLIMQEQVVRFNEMNEWDLAVGVRRHYHKNVHRERAGFMLRAISCIFVLRRTVCCAGETFSCKPLPESTDILRTSTRRTRESLGFLVVYVSAFDPSDSLSKSLADATSAPPYLES